MERAKPAGRNVARGVAVGLASALAAAAFVELTRPRGGQGQLIDWGEVRKNALHRAGDRRLDPARQAAVEARYAELAAEMQGPLFEAVGAPKVELPPFQALGAVEWLDVNLGILQRVIDPLVAQSRVPNSRLVALGRAGIDRYTGLVLGFLSTRVLGQFDPQLLGHEPVTAALYLVEPNVAEWEAEAGLPGDDLRRWLILHETTHAWQFAAHPWLADFMNDAIRELLALGDPARGSAAQRLLSLTLGLPSQWAVLKRVQAAMTLVEGYSNLVMNLAGRKRLASFDQLEAAYARRSGEKSALEVLFWKLTGLDLKLQQYERGEKFARAVYEAHGMGVLNLAWQSAEDLPSLDELGRPEAWVRRVTGVRAGRRAPAPA
jgi:coenzyme F420 biosynthesis associated uncharacterized protein